MSDYYQQHYSNPVFVINTELQAIEIPKNFHQIFGYDKKGDCVGFSKNKRFLSSGLGAGVFTDKNIFYKFIPEKETIPPIEKTYVKSNKASTITILDWSIDKFEYGNDNTTPDNNVRQEQSSCSLLAGEDTYVV